MIGTFRPTEIGSFRPTQNGRFRPTLTVVLDSVSVVQKPRYAGAIAPCKWCSCDGICSLQGLYGLDLVPVSFTRRWLFISLATVDASLSISVPISMNDFFSFNPFWIPIRSSNVMCLYFAISRSFPRCHLLHC